MKKSTAIILAGGSGKRMNTEQKKQYLEIGGEPVIVRTIKAFERYGKCNVILVCPKEDIEYCNEEIVKKYNLKSVKNVVCGGKERYDSVINGLAACELSEDDIVIIHDGARPFVTKEAIERSVLSAQNCGSGVCAVKTKDTVKLANSSGKVTGTPNRDMVYIIQTPQTFRFGIIDGAYKKMREEMDAGNVYFNITDDAMVAEHFSDEDVYLCEGDYTNIKITTPDDLAYAEMISGNKK